GVSNRISFFFSSSSPHTTFSREWSSDVCSSDLEERTYQGFQRLFSCQQGIALVGGGSLSDRLQYFRGAVYRHVRIWFCPGPGDRSEGRRGGERGGTGGLGTCKGYRESIEGA